jgi:acetyltransferase-like isoleucine patch superfamily enzyme
MSPLREIETRGGTYFAHVDATVDKGADVGAGTKIWAGAHIFSGARVGESCIVGEGVGIESGAILGDFSKVQSGVRLYGGVEAGDYVFFGPNSTTTNDRNPRAFGDWELSKTVIETGASIGANSTLIAGNRIGALGLVAAGSVVSKDVQPGSIVMGNPARFYGWVDVSGAVISREGAPPEEIVRMLVDPRQCIEIYLQRKKSGQLS